MKDIKNYTLKNRLTSMRGFPSVSGVNTTCHLHYMDRCGCVCVSVLRQPISTTPEALEELHYTQTCEVYIMLFAVTTTSHFLNF